MFISCQIIGWFQWQNIVVGQVLLVLFVFGCKDFDLNFPVAPFTLTLLFFTLYGLSITVAPEASHIICAMGVQRAMDFLIFFDYGHLAVFQVVPYFWIVVVDATK